MDIVKKIETPYNNAVAILNRTNELLNENNIMDSTGTEIAQLEQNVANPAWLFALACGQLHTSWQEQIAKAYAALDPQNCEDDQVLVLASLAGIKRGNGTPSHITVLIENTSAEDITVPFGTTFTETYANQTWVLNRNISLGANAKQYTTLYTTTDGEYDVPEETSFNYDGTLSITCVSTSSSSGGTTIESISSLRNRISQGIDTSNLISQAKTAIELLSGVDSCSIWFNTSSTNNLTIGSGSSATVLVTISNTDAEDITVPAWTQFEDTLGNLWELNVGVDIVGSGQTQATLYSVEGGDIVVTSGDAFTYTGDLPITCVAINNSVAGFVVIPPRTAYVSIKGYDYSGKVAETYYNYLNIPATIGDVQEQYLLGQQPLTLNFDYSQEINVKIYITMKSSDMAIGADDAVKSVVMSHSGTLACGENVTSQMVSEWVQNLGYGTIVDCSVGTPTGMISNISPVEYCVFSKDSIFVNTI